MPRRVTMMSFAKVIKQGTRKAYVIDDSQYLMAFFMFNHVNETGYGNSQSAL